MAQKDPRSEATENVSPFNLMPTDLAAMSKKRIEDVVNAQAELFEELQGSNKQWIYRMQLEANLASDLASKLTSARWFPETLTACQEWGSRHLEMMAEDGKHVFADAQKVMETSARLLLNGWRSNSKGRGIST
jgi:hypothetical protein